MIRVIWLQTATVFWLRGGAISLSYWMCMGLMQLRQKEKHTAGPPGPEPSVFEFEMAIEKLKRPISPVLIKLYLNWLKRDVRQFALRLINLLILSEIRRKCLSSRRSRSFYLFIRGVLKQIDVIIEAYPFVNYIQNFIQHPAVKWTPYAEEIIGGDFDATSQLLIIYSAFVIYIKKDGSTI